ncbi:MAG: hypothetical protein VB111_06020 [Clostridiaceae bacterium]|nr:hypothetical protein [Clostridiaceae bacterium]
MNQRFRDTNDLKIVRPPLLIDEIPWQQMNFDGSLTCICEDESLRRIEYSFRMNLFRDKYFKCDNFIIPFWGIRKSYSSTGNGFNIRENIIRAENTDIQSHHFFDMIPDEAALEAFHLPVITPHPEEDAENMAKMQELFGDTIPVVLEGESIIYHAPWDVIPRLHGVDNVLYDIYDRPEFLHKIIGLFTDAARAEMDQKEKFGLYTSGNVGLHCTPGFVTLPEGKSPENGTCCTTWFRTMAQMFSSISPAAHEEFDLQYSRPLAERCAYTYYGCCEPLHDRLDYIKKYKNLRKVGASPWANVESTAVQLGHDYVMSRKPNPAHVAIKTDPEVIRKEITETVKAAQKYGCPCDITLKDISTVSNRPENLIVWAETASEVLDEYYGEE